MAAPVGLLSRQGYRHPVYAGDSSENAENERVAEEVRHPKDRINLVYLPFPGLDDVRAMSELLHAADEPYATLIWRR